ncbi:MAG: FtsX-like permease family protein, partial [Rhodothermales bacterium]|nr:FtsX-like permease family protein [Rhodothermales bacterium]
MALSVIGVALGVAVVVGIDLANSSASSAFRLSAETVTGKATHQIVGSVDNVDETVYTLIRTKLGIRESAPVVEGFARVPQDPGRTIQILGVDPLAEAPFRTFTGGTESDLDLGAFMGRSGTVLVAEPVSRALNLTTGDELQVLIGGFEHSLEIVAVMIPDGELSVQAMANLLVVDIATAQALFSLEGQLSRIDLLIADTQEGAVVFEKLKSELPAGTEVRRSSSRTETVEQMTRAFRLNLTALSLLALVVGMFLIYNTTTFSVVQRRSLIGRLRALGVTKREIFSMILREALGVAIVGTLLGIVSGLFLGRGLVQLVSQTINDLYYVVQVRAIDVSVWTLVKGVSLGIVATLVATIPPAREATSAPASIVLRRSEEETRLHSKLPV